MTQHQTRPQPALPSPFTPPPKRSKLWLQLTITISIPVIVTLALLLHFYGLPNLTPAPATHTVVYTTEADGNTGSGRTGMVTAQTPGGGNAQQTGLLPITGTFTFHAGDFVYVSVQNQQGAGSVTCRITVDGAVVSENTSSGGYVIATCQGTVPR